MATRRIQRRRERRGEPGTALLAPLVLGLGLVLACLGLLLAMVSLGSRASLFAQEPSQRDLVAEEDPDPLVSGRWVLAPWLLSMGSVCPACARHVCGGRVHQPSHAWVHE